MLFSVTVFTLIRFRGKPPESGSATPVKTFVSSGCVPYAGTRAENGQMRVEDLRSLSQIGQALWIDPVLSKQRTAETLQAVGLLSIADDRILERASSALLARAQNER